MVSKEEFKKEVWQIAEEIHAEPMQVRLCIMKNKVGSCSPNKVITFDISILNLDENFRREAIIHELLHLRYRNHGKMFKEILRTYIARRE